jgi:hypothetical protein
MARRRRALLLYFVCDFFRDAKLQRKILGDPAGALKTYGLSKAQIGIIMSRSNKKIREAIGKELQSLGRPVLDRHPAA